MIVEIEEHIATKVTNMSTRQGQAQSKTLREVVDLSEEIKQTTSIILINAWSCILHHKPHIRLHLSDSNGDILTIGVLGGIRPRAHHR